MTLTQRRNETFYRLPFITGGPFFSFYFFLFFSLSIHIFFPLPCVLSRLGIFFLLFAVISFLIFPRPLGPALQETRPRLSLLVCVLDVDNEAAVCGGGCPEQETIRIRITGVAFWYGFFSFLFFFSFSLFLSHHGLSWE